MLNSKFQFQTEVVFNLPPFPSLDGSLASVTETPDDFNLPVRDLYRVEDLDAQVLAEVVADASATITVEVRLMVEFRDGTKSLVEAFDVVLTAATVGRGKSTRIPLDGLLSAGDQLYIETETTTTAAVNYTVQPSLILSTPLHMLQR